MCPVRSVYVRDLKLILHWKWNPDLSIVVNKNPLLLDKDASRKKYLYIQKARSKCMLWGVYFILF